MEAFILWGLGVNKTKAGSKNSPSRFLGTVARDTNPQTLPSSLTYAFCLWRSQQYKGVSDLFNTYTTFCREGNLILKLVTDTILASQRLLGVGRQREVDFMSRSLLPYFFCCR